MVGSNKWQLFGQRRIYLIAVVLVFVFAMGLGLTASGQNSPTRLPSDVVREFYKAMREHRFKDAWSMTIYKPAVEGLTAQEMEELRVDFEEKTAEVPEQIEITGEKISAKTATVFVKVPVTVSTP